MKPITLNRVKMICLLCACWLVIGNRMAWADDSIEDRVLQVLENYIEAEIRYDARAVIDSWHPVLLDAEGGRKQVLETKEKMYRAAPRYRLTPDRVVLGDPHLHRIGAKMIARVPVSSVTRGFPVDVESRGSYTLISTNQGETWYVVDNSCMGQAEARKIFPDLLKWRPDDVDGGTIDPRVIIRSSD